MKLKKTLAAMLATAIAVTGIQILPATEGLEKVGKDLGVVKEAKAANRNWGSAVPDSSIQVGDTINWNNHEFRAVKKDGNGTLMLSQDSFGECTWYEILDAYSENGGALSKTSNWFDGLKEEQRKAMKTMPEIKCEPYGCSEHSEYSRVITRTKLFPVSIDDVKGVGYNRRNYKDYWTRSYFYKNGNPGYQTYCNTCGQLYDTYETKCTKCNNDAGSFNDYDFSAWWVHWTGDFCDNLPGDNNYVIPAFYLNSCQHTNTTSTVLTPANCTSKGTTKYTCSCGETWTAQDIPALGHDFNNLVCNHDGTDSMKCTRCDAVGSTPACTHKRDVNLVVQDTTTNTLSSTYYTVDTDHASIQLPVINPYSDWTAVGWTTSTDPNSHDTVDAGTWIAVS